MSIKLNLGSGKQNKDGFINIDAVKHTEDTEVGDILDLQYSDGSVEEIYSAHVIEHLDKKEFNLFFDQVSRVLCKGGKLTIIAPAFQTAIYRYIAGDIDIETLENFLFARHEHEYDYHKQGIYKEKLENLCDKFGFEVDTLRFQDREGSRNEIKLVAYKK